MSVVFRIINYPIGPQLKSSINNRVFLTPKCIASINQTASIQRFPMPPEFIDVDMPPEENRKLPTLDKTPPLYNTAKQMKMMKKLIHIRGPELVHNQLIFKQFGIMALCGGNLKHGHIEMIRNGINRKIDTEKSFAVWRIDPPWKPITKKGVGKGMGGGKGAINHYVTPIKAGRIVVEIGGKIEYEEVYNMLNIIANKMPVDAIVVSQKILDDLYKEEQELEQKNINPFTFEYVIKKNMHGCNRWVSTYDHTWFGKYI